MFPFYILNITTKAVYPPPKLRVPSRWNREGVNISLKPSIIDPLWKLSKNVSYWPNLIAYFLEHGGFQRGKKKNLKDFYLAITF